MARTRSAPPSPPKPQARAAAARARASAGKVTAQPRVPTVRRARPAAEPITPASLATPVGPRRAVFIDVENSSSEADLVRVLDDLAIDRGTTELTAVGNWRVVGHQLGRTLAQRGAHLVHSAPAPRVPDWSDLWIAVSAGMWLGRARAGDIIDIISDDRAFDAVGDAASRLGVAFRRITYRTHPAGMERESPAHAGAPRDEQGRRRRRRRRSGGVHEERPQLGPHAGVAMNIPPARAPAAEANGEPHAASQEQIRAAIARLTAADPERGVNLDALSVALKAEGFQRPPGSPRLVTRLRRLKDVELLSSGRVRLIGAGTASAPLHPRPSHAGVAAEQSVANDGGVPRDRTDAGQPPAGAKRRSRRRGGRRRSGRRRAAAGPTVELGD